MSDHYIGEIRLFAGNYAPTGWALCDGREMLIVENPDLYAVLGTRWGGNGVNTFHLPDFGERVVVGSGRGPQLTDRSLAQTGGVDQASIDAEQMPFHSHQLMASTSPATSARPWEYTVLAAAASPTAPAGREGLPYVQTISGNPRMLADDTIEYRGQSVPHDNHMPALTVTYIIALFGIAPAP